ncbi:acyl-CoA N-acyltransferase [Syncephalis fuscata]|nr:acyl-CoA N-acyltransferase [Syncephalis fuscata]
MAVYYAHVNGMRKTIAHLTVSNAQISYLPPLDIVLAEIQRLERRTFPRSEHTWPGEQPARLNPRQHVIFAFSFQKTSKGINDNKDNEAINKAQNKHKQKSKKKQQTDKDATLKTASQPVPFSLIGYLTLQLDPSRSQIIKLAVTPDQRGKGIGSILVQQATLLSVVLGRDRCELHVDPDRESARRLYNQCGFEERGVADDYYGPGRNAIVLRWQSN